VLPGRALAGRGSLDRNGDCRTTEKQRPLAPGPRNRPGLRLQVGVERGTGTFNWPPAGTKTWPHVATFAWPRTYLALQADSPTEFAIP
jgi:hypothetical protein